VDEYILAHDGQVDEFDGTLDDYHRWINKRESRDDQLNAKTAEKKIRKSGSGSASVASTSGLNKKQQRQKAAEERKALSAMTSRIKRIEEKIESANGKLKAVESLLADTTLYEEAQRDQLSDLIHQQAELKGELESLEENWLQLHEQLETGAPEVES
jgi:ATP-binding cassette subfamily F protein 3